MSEYRIGHLEVDSPWGNAGGVVKTPEEVELMSHTGVGWIEAGSYTLEPRPGNGPNGETVYYHDPDTGETYNSLGMPNKGMDEVGKQIPEMVEVANAHNKPLVVNVAPTSEDPVTESQELVDRAYEAGADAVLLNAGCPNVVTKDGQRHSILSHNPEAFADVISGLESIAEKYEKGIFVRTSPFETYEDARSVLRPLGQLGVVSAVFTPNTWPGHIPRDTEDNEILEVPGGAGGKSGPAMADEAYKQTGWVLSSPAVGGSRKGIDVVSSSGITTGEELARRMQLGAVAGCGTTLYYESAQEGWSEATSRLLWEYERAIS